MNQNIEYNIILISDQLSIEQIIFSRRNRDWQEFDRSSYLEKLIIRLDELQYFEDCLDPEYKRNLYDR